MASLSLRTMRWPGVADLGNSINDFKFCLFPFEKVYHFDLNVGLRQVSEHGVKEGSTLLRVLLEETKVGW
jgi:hypothetical protein